MKEIPTAKEFINKTEIKQRFGFTFTHKIENMMIEFAKLHVEAALKQASKDADMTDESLMSLQEGSSVRIDKDSILDAYPLTNIK